MGVEDELVDERLVEESIFFGDDPKMICDMLKTNWSLGPDDLPTITIMPEEFMTSARVAAVYVYQISRYNSVSSTDYGTIQRTSFIAIKLQTRFRHKFLEYMQEVYRILMAHRRIGSRKLGGYTYFEIINDRVTNDLTGWYACTLDVKLTAYTFPVKTGGFGNRINRMIKDYNPN